LSSLFSKKGTENAMLLPALYEFSVNPRLLGKKKKQKKPEYSSYEVISTWKSTRRTERIKDEGNRLVGWKPFHGLSLFIS